MSLRARVIAAVMLIAGILVVVLAFVTRTTEANLIAQVDAQLVAAQGRVGELAGRDGPRAGEPDETGVPDDPRQPLSPLYVAVLSEGQTSTLVQPGLRDDELPPPEVDADRVSRELEDGKPFTISNQGADVRWRVVVAPVGSSDEVRLTAMPLDDVDAAVRDLIRLEVAGAGLIFAALALVAFWVVRLGIRPVRDMTGVAEAIAAGDLTERVPDSDPSTEVGRLGEALNAMLTSIEVSFEERRAIEDRLRQFVADASHELRTPVATIRGYAELYRTGALAQRDDLDDAMRRTEQEALRMGDLVDDLLSLARLDQRRPLEKTRVDLVAVAEDAANDARAMAPARTVHAVAEDEVVAVQADEPKIRQIVANLVANALVHTPADAAIVVHAGFTDAAEPFIEVADDGPGMEPAVADHVFERFFRAEASRSRHRGGSGLGLSIVEATAKAHDGRVELDSRPGRGTTVRVVLPADSPSG